MLVIQIYGPILTKFPYGDVAVLLWDFCGYWRSPWGKGTYVLQQLLEVSSDLHQHSHWGNSKLIQVGRSSPEQGFGYNPLLPQLRPVLSLWWTSLLQHVICQGSSGLPAGAPATNTVTNRILLTQTLHRIGSLILIRLFLKGKQDKLF